MWPQKPNCNASAASALDTHSITADMRLGVPHVAAPTSAVGALPRENSLSVVAVQETTWQTTGAVLSEVTATRKTARPKKPQPKSTAGPNLAAGKPKKKATTCVKTVAAKTTTPTWWSPPKHPPPHLRKFLISSIAFPSKHVWS
jgi:hypothetical protein